MGPGRSDSALDKTIRARDEERMPQHPLFVCSGLAGGAYAPAPAWSLRPRYTEESPRPTSAKPSRR